MSTSRLVWRPLVATLALLFSSIPPVSAATVTTTPTEPFGWNPWKQMGVVAKVLKISRSCSNPTPVATLEVKDIKYVALAFRFGFNIPNENPNTKVSLSDPVFAVKSDVGVTWKSLEPPVSAAHPVGQTRIITRSLQGQVWNLIWADGKAVLSSKVYPLPDNAVEIYWNGSVVGPYINYGNLWLNAIHCSPVVNTTILPKAEAGAQYSFKLSAKAGIAPYTWKPLLPLPTGLSLYRTGHLAGLITGTPRDLGVDYLWVQVSDNIGKTSNVELRLQVAGELGAS
jgi:hypothetical protein